MTEKPVKIEHRIINSDLVAEYIKAIDKLEDDLASLSYAMMNADEESMVYLQDNYSYTQGIIVWYREQLMSLVDLED